MQTRNQISQLKRQLTDYKMKLQDVLQAKDDASQDNDIQTDDYYRIPAIMQDCKTAYNLTWDGDGYWSGYTYVRKAHARTSTGF